MNMKTPMSDKSEAMINAIDSLLPGTKAKIASNCCPICGKSIVESEFRDALSVREYEISGMCQKCQDDIFG